MPSSVSPVPDALLLFNPVYANGPIEGEGEDASEAGYGYDRVQDRWSEVSPLHLIEAGDAAPPPSWVTFGEGDPLVPVTTMQRFQVACQAKGSVSELVIYAGEAHGFFNMGRGEHFFMTLDGADLFLQERGWLSAPEGPTSREFFPK